MHCYCRNSMLMGFAGTNISSQTRQYSYRRIATYMYIHYVIELSRNFNEEFYLHSRVAALAFMSSTAHTREEYHMHSWVVPHALGEEYHSHSQGVPLAFAWKLNVALNLYCTYNHWTQNEVLLVILALDRKSYNKNFYYFHY